MKKLNFLTILLMSILTFVNHTNGQDQRAGTGGGGAGGGSGSIPLDQLVNNVFTGGSNNNQQGTGPAPGPTPNIGGGGTGTGMADYSPSYTPCGDGKICVPFYNCNNETNSIITDGSNLIDIRFDDKKACASYLETCCNTDVKSVETQEPITPKPIVDFNGACGKRNVDGLVFKITGGVQGEAEYGEFPWMIAVLKHEKINNEIINIYQCGGSLIHPNVVLTGAHCVYKNNAFDFIVRAGEWDTQTKDEIYKEQDRQVIEIVLHEKFSKGGLHNDVALLFTAEAFNLGEDVNTICLPPPYTNFDHQRCYATGWGKDQFGQKGKYQVIMKKIDLPIIPNDVCQDRLRQTRLGKFFQLHESFICAGGEPGKDTCKGDGGGPLVCENKAGGQKDQYYQAGIVAWGIDCGKTNPGVYASVSYLREWIDEAMESRNFDKIHYSP